MKLHVGKNENPNTMSCPPHASPRAQKPIAGKHLMPNCPVCERCEENWLRQRGPSFSLRSCVFVLLFLLFPSSPLSVGHSCVCPCTCSPRVLPEHGKAHDKVLAASPRLPRLDPQRPGVPPLRPFRRHHLRRRCQFAAATSHSPRCKRRGVPCRRHDRWRNRHNRWRSRNLVAL